MLFFTYSCYVCVRVYMPTIQRYFQLKMHAISAAFWFFDPIQHCECSSTQREKEEEKCVFMVTTEMLIAHEKWMIGKVNFCFKWYRDPDIHITQTHRCEFESVKLQTE